MPGEEAPRARMVSCRHLSIAGRAAHPADLLLHYAAMAADGPKSAFELAMERLRLKDKEAGVDEHPLTDAQKAAIAEARQVYEARMAEREILHQDALRKATTYEEVERLNEEFRRDKDRLATDRDRKTAEARRSAAE